MGKARGGEEKEFRNKLFFLDFMRKESISAEPHSLEEKMPPAHDPSALASGDLPHGEKNPQAESVPRAGGYNAFHYDNCLLSPSRRASSSGMRP